MMIFAGAGCPPVPGEIAPPSEPKFILCWASGLNLGKEVGGALGKPGRIVLARGESANTRLDTDGPRKLDDLIIDWRHH